MVNKDLYSKRLDLEKKTFFFDVKENVNGKYLKVTESSGGRSTIVVPFESVELFRNMVNDIIDHMKAES